MKRLVIGILAHVDAGKTTLSEAILYEAGVIRNMGRVDKKDAFLDTHSLERGRGITIFSKQAVFSIQDISVTLLDTPGHVDFSSEMERTLQVLDYGILVVNGADGVQAHTKTLWQLLKRYHVPVFIFINKMDQPGTNKEELLLGLKKGLSEGCTDFSGEDNTVFYENLAMCDENALEQFLEKGIVEKETTKNMIRERKVFPCFFGSALKSEGVSEFLEGIQEYVLTPDYLKEFGAKIFKISRDLQGNRLTFMKITGGSLKVKTPLTNSQEKVNQIRIYSGEKYTTVNEVHAGEVCAVTGLSDTKPGEGLGSQKDSEKPVLEPVITYGMRLPEGVEPSVMLPKLNQLAEEQPELHIFWNEHLKEIQVRIMGQVQIEILKSLVLERFGVEIELDEGKIVYKETIKAAVEGVGHYEPLKHYAEVHLLLEPGEVGSGMRFCTDCSEDLLDKNWQRLVLTHLEEKEHVGVLTGSAITDMKITLIGGKAHLKHTEGGDFRQATYRAIRQGLMEAESVLLEPYYEFKIEVPEQNIGRVMMDIERMSGSFEPFTLENGLAVLNGSVPVSEMNGYQKELTAYTKGQGRLTCRLKGYESCHNTETVMAEMDYDPKRDLENPSDSVFCAHGAGFSVSWDKVKEHRHVDCQLKKAGADLLEKTLPEGRKEQDKKQSEIWLGTEEIDAILERTYGANKKDKGNKRTGYGKTIRAKEAPVVNSTPFKKQEPKEEYLLVDGYNVIFAWQELKELAETNIDGARGRLLDILCNYQAIKKCNLIVVFDAYRIKGHQTEILDYHNIHVVYTKEAETADQFIEKFAHENGKRYQITVATSDGLEQIIIRGQGCNLISARELQAEIRNAGENLYEQFSESQPKSRNNLLEEVLKQQAKQFIDK